jgi:cytochrome c oxidase cbb3-type subunit 3
MVDHSHQDIDAATGTSTTGHEWDGIKELNTPLPKWWLYILYATMVWAVGYWVVYPAIPLPGGFTPGISGYTNRGSVPVDLAALHAQRAALTDALTKASLTDIEKDQQLLGFARSLGKAAFGDNCAPCHGSGAQGAKGYPNLNDDDWIWGGKLDQISATITHGARNDDADSHQGAMPAFGRDGILKADEIEAVVSYVRSLSGLEKGDFSKGQKIFADNCAACHSDNAKGNQDVGALNLTDQIWLYGGDRPTVIETVTNGRGGVMPSWSKRLDPTTIKALTVYVHTLGGGQ